MELSRHPSSRPARQPAVPDDRPIESAVLHNQQGQPTESRQAAVKTRLPIQTARPLTTWQSGSLGRISLILLDLSACQSVGELAVWQRTSPREACVPAGTSTASRPLDRKPVLVAASGVPYRFLLLSGRDPARERPPVRVGKLPFVARRSRNAVHGSAIWVRWRRNAVRLRARSGRAPHLPCAAGQLILWTILQTCLA
jgi:hypothetical protein